MGAFLGSTLGASQVQAAKGAKPGGVDTRQMPTVGPGTPGQCNGELVVSKVNSRTITVTRSDGSTATIHINSRTRYTQNGHSATVSAVVVGSKIYVVGSCTGQGRTINATSIEIVG
jgi:hypothetical protein